MCTCRLIATGHAHTRIYCILEREREKAKKSYKVFHWVRSPSLCTLAHACARDQEFLGKVPQVQTLHIQHWTWSPRVVAPVVSRHSSALPRSASQRGMASESWGRWGFNHLEPMKFEVHMITYLTYGIPVYPIVKQNGNAWPNPNFFSKVETRHPQHKLCLKISLNLQPKSNVGFSLLFWGNCCVPSFQHLTWCRCSHVRCRCSLRFKGGCNKDQAGEPNIGN